MYKLLLFIAINLYSYDIRAFNDDLISNTKLIIKVQEKLKLKLISNGVKNADRLSYLLVQEIIDKEIKLAIKRSTK